jgi:DNA repair photolyase
MRFVENPPNPYLGEHRALLGPPPPARLKVYEEQADAILARNDSPDLPFRWSLNPYRGCQHACAYCYARCTHEYLGFGAGTDFDTQIVVKINAPERLVATLKRRGWRREPIMFSGATDCYQPLEAVYRVTRRCLEVCADAANPVVIVTKAGLIARDVDVLVELERRAGVRVCFSIPFADSEVARRLEPYGPPPSWQFEAMRRLASAGVPVGVLVCPIIPGLSDREIPAILRQAADAGASTASYAPVRLPGSVQQVFLARLRAELPDVAERVMQRIRDVHGGVLDERRPGKRMCGQGAYWESVARLFEAVAARVGLDCGRREEEEARRPVARQLRLF